VNRIMEADMKRTIGWAASVALVMLGALTPAAFAQCPNILIKWDADCFVYETNPVLSAQQLDGYYAWKTQTGSQMTVVGLATLFCNPLDSMVPDLPNKEYSFIWTGLTATANSADQALGACGRRWTGSYSGGTFAIYEDSPADAPRETTPMPAPGGIVPANFVDGTLMLSGTLGTLNWSVTRSQSPSSPCQAPPAATHTWTGTFTTTWIATGGPMFTNTVMAGWNYGTGLPVQGNWCNKYPTGCTPTGYTAHNNGQFFPPSPTESTRSTWGAIKQLYR
jgi:hypothetical protein